MTELGRGVNETADIPVRRVREGGRRMARKPKLGSGKRFASLKQRLGKQGAKNPGALAAYIGRKKYGAKRFAKLGAKGK
jgi:hypothetical protein